MDLQTDASSNAKCGIFVHVVTCPCRTLTSVTQIHADTSSKHSGNGVEEGQGGAVVKDNGVEGGGGTESDMWVFD